MKVAAFDLETTGFLLPDNVRLKKQPRIIEICICFFDDEEPENLKYWSTLINPGKNITKKITEVTGITQKMLYDSKHFHNVIPDIRKRLGNAHRIVAHNLYFDKRVLELEFIRRKEILNWPISLFCTSEHTEHFFGKRLKMYELYEFLTGKEVDQRKIHRAKEDVKMLVEAYMQLKEMGLAEDKYNDR